MNESEKRFAFGKNWKDYLENGFSEQAFERAVSSLRDFLGDISLQGKSFLDVGCGSGIHSLAAKALGAKKIVSVDFDKDSIACTKRLVDDVDKNMWVVKQGSLLNRDFMNSLGTFDVVYCWGVAHHTGDMWSALDQLAHNVQKGGYLFVAIYNSLEGYKGSKTWLHIKRFYTHAPKIVQKIMEYLYFSSHIIKMLTHLKNPIRIMREYKKKRGMSYCHDLLDWLGGYPYEHAKSEELFHFYSKKYNMELINLKTSNFLGNNQLLFRKR